MRCKDIDFSDFSNKQNEKCEYLHLNFIILLYSIFKHIKHLIISKTMLLRIFSIFFCVYCLILRFCFLVLHLEKGEKMRNLIPGIGINY